MPKISETKASNPPKEEDYMAARRNEVQQVIGKLIARAWSNEEFKRALIEDPQAMLKAEGLYFPERYTVEFYEDPGASPGDWYSVGRDTNAVHRFPIPPRPNAQELTDNDLDGYDLNCVACCSPCASCTGAVAPENWY